MTTAAITKTSQFCIFHKQRKSKLCTPRTPRTPRTCSLQICSAVEDVQFSLHISSRSSWFNLNVVVAVALVNRDLTQKDGWKTQDDRMTKKCRARLRAQHFCVILSAWILQPSEKSRDFRETGPRGPFLESPETFRAHFGWHNSLCIFKTKASRGTKLCSYFNFYLLYNIRTEQLYRVSRSEFHEWLFGPEILSGLSKNGPLLRKVPSIAQTGLKGKGNLVSNSNVAGDR